MENHEVQTKFFTLPMVLGAALFSVAAVTLLSLLTGGSDEFFALEARLASTVAGHAQLYYDRGGGLNERDSSQASLRRSETPVLCRLSLPPGRFATLRFDVIDREGTVIIDDTPRIVDREGRVVRVVAFSEIEAGNQIQSLRERDGRLEVITTVRASDPQLAIHFSRPLELRAPWQGVARGILLRSLGMFAALAAVLLALDRLPFAPGQSRWQRLREFTARPPLVVTLAACALILYARKPDAFHNPQFWAEDGTVFYQQAYTLGARALVMPYASYLHAAPRLVAAASTWLDPLWAPAVFIFAALAGTLYVAARTQSARCALPRHAACALAVVLVPDAFEVLLNLANLQWILAAGFALLLTSADPKRWGQFLHDVGAALLLGLTGPFSILLAPLFVWRVWRRRTWASAMVAAFAIAAAATQIWTVWHYPPGAENKVIDADALLAVPGMRVVASLFAGYRVPMDYSRAVESLLGAIALAGVAALAIRRGVAGIERRWLAFAFAALLLSSLYRCRYILPDLCHAGFGSRYFFPLQLLAIWLLLAAATDRRRWLARGAVLVAAWAVAINLPRLREPPLADFCWADYAPAIRAGEAATVPVNPAPWVLQLPARRSGTLVAK